MKLPQFYIDDIIRRGLSEDINYIDVTSDYLIDEEKVSAARFVSKDSGVLAGIEIAMRVFTLLDDTVSFQLLKKDGDRIRKGDIILTMQGHTAALLKGERTALNLVQHMSGIATATARCVELVKGTNASITDTRKTLPGLRALQKYAVVTGGGKNHRYNLSDAAMLKDNHIDAYGSLTNAVNALREKVGHMVRIEVEVRTLEELREALIDMGLCKRTTRPPGMAVLNKALVKYGVKIQSETKCVREGKAVKMLTYWYIKKM
mgnify:CR=1 FL=1